MSFINFPSEINFIKSLIREGNYTTALNRIEPLMVLPELSNNERLTCKLTIIDILYHSGEFKQVITFADALYDESIISNALVYAIDAYTFKFNALWHLGKFDDSLQIIDVTEKLLETGTLISYKEVQERKAAFYLRRGAIYADKGELDSALENTFKSLALYQELGLKREIARSFNNIGIIFQRKGDLIEALKYFKKDQAILLELNNKESLVTNYGNIGSTFYLKGDIDIAKEYFENGLDLCIKYNFKKFLPYTNRDLGRIYYEKGEHLKAYEHFIKALALHEEIGNEFEISRILYFIITLMIDLNDSEKIQYYLQKLQNIDKKSDNPIIHQRTRLVEALRLKKTNRSIKIAKAQEIFAQISNDRIYDYELTVFASFNLCDMLLAELQIYGAEEILFEINTITEQLLTIAKTQNSYSLLAQIYLLQSKLSLIELDTNRAQQLLSQAQVLAEEKGLQHLAIRISNEYDKLLGQLSTWENLIENNATLQERLELVEMEDFLTRLLNKKATDQSNIQPELPIVFLIILENGISIYSKTFQNENVADAQLIGGLITAINTISGEAFSVHGSLERLKHKEYTMLLQHKDNILFCYAYKGPSYYAQQKFNRCIEILQQNVSLWQDMNKEKSLGLTQESISIITTIVDQIFS